MQACLPLMMSACRNGSNGLQCNDVSDKRFFMKIIAFIVYVLWLLFLLMGMRNRGVISAVLFFFVGSGLYWAVWIWLDIQFNVF